MPQCFQPPGSLSQASPEHGNQRPLGRVTVELLVVSLLFVAVCGCLLAAGWEKWGEVLIDYGREISIPWRIARGEMLYRDISFAYGPLSPYTQALLFALFGPSLTVVLVADAAILGLILLAAAWLVFLVTDVTVAVCAAMVLVVISGLNHMMGIAIFNLLTPYSHALTYGLALSLASLVVSDGPRPPADVRQGLGNRPVGGTGPSDQTRGVRRPGRGARRGGRSPFSRSGMSRCPYPASSWLFFPRSPCSLPRGVWRPGQRLLAGASPSVHDAGLGSHF